MLTIGESKLGVCMCAGCSSHPATKCVADIPTPDDVLKGIVDFVISVAPP